MCFRSSISDGSGLNSPKNACITPDSKRRVSRERRGVDPQSATANTKRSCDTWAHQTLFSRSEANLSLDDNPSSLYTSSAQQAFRNRVLCEVWRPCRNVGSLCCASRGDAKCSNYCCEIFRRLSVLKRIHFLISMDNVEDAGGPVSRNTAERHRSISRRSTSMFNSYNAEIQLPEKHDVAARA